ncbi:MAG: flagellar assembly protein FliW [Peptococcaceae bacterium]|nr:flagellar assembly protein FliW [Candidatus Syntrophopropionicum ammoniitolerans]
MAQKISFPWGLPGLEDYQEFTFNLLGKDSAFCFLQAVRQPEVGLLVVNPYVYFSDYRIQLSREVAGRLKIEHQKQVAVLCTVNTSRGADEATVNLLAPIIINTKQLLGKQVVLTDSNYSFRTPFAGRAKREAL